MPKKKLVIFPYNGNGLEALDCIDSNQYDFIGFVDDNQSKSSANFPLFTRAVLERFQELFILAVPGSPTSFKERIQVINSLPINNSLRFISVVHSTASLGRDVTIGYNCMIGAGAVLTSNACVKNHVCVFPNSVIHHDVVVEDYSLIGSNVVIAGSTRIGKNCYIGSGTNIINGITVEDGSLVGLGSNITRNVSTNSKMVGNPARDISIK